MYASSQPAFFRRAATLDLEGSPWSKLRAIFRTSA